MTGSSLPRVSGSREANVTICSPNPTRSNVGFDCGGADARSDVGATCGAQAERQRTRASTTTIPLPPQWERLGEGTSNGRDLPAPRECPRKSVSSTVICSIVVGALTPTRCGRRGSSSSPVSPSPTAVGEGICSATVRKTSSDCRRRSFSPPTAGFRPDPRAPGALARSRAPATGPGGCNPTRPTSCPR